MQAAVACRCFRHLTFANWIHSGGPREATCIVAALGIFSGTISRIMWPAVWYKKLVLQSKNCFLSLSISVLKLYSISWFLSTLLSCLNMVASGSTTTVTLATSTFLTHKWATCAFYHCLQVTLSLNRRCGKSTELKFISFIKQTTHFFSNWDLIDTTLEHRNQSSFYKCRNFLCM